MRLVLATRAKHDPNLLSLSRIRYFGACPYGVASRSCWATQASVGDRVTPTWITLRDCSSMRKKAKSGRKNRSVTCTRVACPELSGLVARDRSPTSGLVAGRCEQFSCPSEWFACRHECLISIILPESFQHPR